jgi:hypothetical protein
MRTSDVSDSDSSEFAGSLDFPAGTGFSCYRGDRVAAGWILPTGRRRVRLSPLKETV